jgi:hypothetical protein
MTRKLALAAATVVMLSASLVACGDDTPAVCASADQLKSSVDEVKDIDVTETNGIDELKSQLETIDGNLDQLTNDAKDEFSSQVDKVAATFEALQTSVEVAASDPSADTVAAAAAAWSAFTTSVKTLISDVQSTC